jgi:hypothetical protein
LGVSRDFAAYKDRRVLYLSFETLEAERLCVRGAEGERHVGDFMYLLLRKRDADLRLFSESCLFRDGYGLARFFPSPGINDLARASFDEIGELLRFFDGSREFDVIVMDLGGECSDSARELMGLCDALILVDGDGVPDVGKRDRAEAFAREAWRRGGDPVFVKNMLKRPYGFDDAASPANGEETSEKPSDPEDGAERILIGYDEASFRSFDGMTDFVLSGEFGLGIRGLADVLFARVYA